MLYLTLYIYEHMHIYIILYMYFLFSILVSMITWSWLDDSLCVKKANHARKGELH